MKKRLIIIVFLLSLILLTTKVEARDIKAIEPKITLESCPIFGDPDADGTRPAVNSKGEVRKDKKGKVIYEAESTAHFLQEILEFIRYLGPALTIVLTIVEFVKAAAVQDNDALAKASKKTGWRIGLCILLFFLPNLINTVFSWFGWYGTCGIG